MQSMLVISPEQLEVFVNESKPIGVTIKNTSDKYAIIRISTPLPINFIVKQPYHVIPPKKEKLVSIFTNLVFEVDPSKQHKLILEYSSSYKGPIEDKDAKEFILKAEKKEKTFIPIIVRRQPSPNQATASTTFISKYKIKPIQKENNVDRAQLDFKSINENKKEESDVQLLKIENEKLHNTLNNITDEYDKLDASFKKIAKDKAKISEEYTILETKCLSTCTADKKQYENSIAMIKEEATNLKLMLKARDSQIHNQTLKLQESDTVINKQREENNRLIEELNHIKKSYETLQIGTNKKTIEMENLKQSIHQYSIKLQEHENTKQKKAYKHCQLATVNKKSNSLILSSIGYITASITNKAKSITDCKTFTFVSLQKNKESTGENKLETLVNFYEEKCSSLNDELNLCKEELKTYMNQMAQHEYKSSVFEESQKHSSALIAGLQTKLSQRDSKITSLCATNDNLLIQLNGLIKQSNTNRLEGYIECMNQFKSSFNKVGEIINKPKSQLTEVEIEVIKHECNSRIKMENSTLLEIQGIIQKCLVVSSHYLRKLQYRSIKIAELYQSKIQLDSENKQDAECAMKQLKSQIPHTKYVSNEQFTNAITDYLEGKKKSLITITKDATQIENTIQQINDANSAFQKRQNIALQQLTKFTEFKS